MVKVSPYQFSEKSAGSRRPYGRYRKTCAFTCGLCKQMTVRKEKQRSHGASANRRKIGYLNFLEITSERFDPYQAVMTCPRFIFPSPGKISQGPYEVALCIDLLSSAESLLVDERQQPVRPTRD